MDAFEKIIKAYTRIAEPLARFKILDQAYSRNMDVQQTLAIFYADILKFHKEAYKFVRRSSKLMPEIVNITNQTGLIFHRLAAVFPSFVGPLPAAF